jgi:hypothetical protein
MSTLHEYHQLALLNLSASKVLITRMSQEKVPIELLGYDVSKCATSRATSETKIFQHMKCLTKFDRYMVPPEVH